MLQLKMFIWGTCDAFKYIEWKRINENSKINPQNDENIAQNRQMSIARMKL